MSQNLLKLQIINGKTRQAVVDEDNDSFGFKEIRIGGVTLTEETVSGLSYELVQTVSGNLHTEIETASGYLQSEMETVSGLLYSELQSVSGVLQTEIDGLSGVIDAILANNPEQWRTVVATASGDTVFSVGFTFDPLPSVLDIEAFINGRRYPQCSIGDFSTGAWRKNSSTQIEFQSVVPQNAEVIVWKQGTSSAGGGGGSSDLTSITVDIRPSVAAAHSLGTLAKPWSGVYLKDTVTSQVYLLQVVSGTFQALEVP